MKNIIHICYRYYSLLLQALVLMVFSQVIFAQSYVSDGTSNWITDRSSGCTSFNQSPKIGETIVWQGGCLNSLIDGPGRLEWYVNGSLTQVSIGIFSKGKHHGHGSMTSYEQGVQKSKYEGGWSNGYRSGFGVYEYANGGIYSGNFKNGERNELGSYKFKNGDEYLGEWVNGKREGVAVILLSNGSKFIGEYRSDLRNGEGILYDSYGKVVNEGIWLDGKFSKRQGVSKSLIEKSNLITSKLLNKKKNGENFGDVKHSKCISLGIEKNTKDFDLCLKSLR